MKKSLLLTLSTIAVASATLLTACGASKSLKVDLSQQVAKKTAITVWMDDPTGNYFTKLKEEFAKVEKNIILKTQKVGNVESLEQLKLKGPSGNGADIVQFPHDRLSSFVSQDLVAPIEGELLTYAQSRVIDQALSLTRFIDPHDKITRNFALPKEVESPGLYYNKALIKKEEIPTTFEEIVKQQKTQAAGTKLYGASDNWTNAYMAEIYLSPFGFRPFGSNGDDPNNIGFATDAYKKGLEYLRQLKTEFSIPETAESHDEELFTSGKAKLLYAGPWKHETFTKANIDFGRVPLPTLNGQKMRPFLGAQLVAVYKNTKHLDEARKFLKFLLDDEAAKVNWEVQGKVPALKSEFLSKIPSLNDNEVVKAMSEDMSQAIPMPSIRQIEFFWGPAETALRSVFGTNDDFDKIQQEAETSYKTAANIQN